MLSVFLSDIQEFFNYEVIDEQISLYLVDLNVIDIDYYFGGYDIESDFLLFLEDFFVFDEFLFLFSEFSDQFEFIYFFRDMFVVGSLGFFSRNRQRFYLNQYLFNFYFGDMFEFYKVGVSEIGFCREFYVFYFLGY